MSARSFLAGAFLFAAVMPLLVFALAFWPTLRAHLDADLSAISRSLLEAVAVQVETSVFARPLSVLPTVLALSGPAALPAERVLEAFAASRPEYYALFVVGPDGRIEARYGASRAVAGDSYPFMVSPLRGALVVSKPYEAGHRALIELSYSEGRRVAVGLVDLGTVTSRLDLETRSPADKVGVVDSGGRFILCSDRGRVSSGEALDPRILAGGSPLLVSEGGTAYYASSLPIPGSDWRAVYLGSAHEADEPMRGFLLRMLLVAAASVLGAAAAAIGMKRAVAGPLEHLISRIELIAAGRYDERIAPNPLPELEEIGSAFNAMAESLQRRDREIQRSEERYRLLFHANRVPSLLVRVPGARIADANAAAEAYYGYSAAELRGLGLADLDELGGRALDEALDRAARTGEGYLTRHRPRSGGARDVEVYVGPLSIGDEPCHYAVVFDVTRRRLAEERTSSALREKTLLLKEVYHRVKNNLQIISSLLSMQAGETRDGAVGVALREGRDRVYAMSLVHELVYQMGDLSSIDAAEYAARLALHAADAYSCPRERLELSLSGVDLGLERAIPFGLALNEMLSNAFKYAGGMSICVSLETLPGDGGPASVLLEVRDEGPGMRAGALEGGAGSLGIPLVRGLAGQLGGSADWSPGRGGRGTRATLRFPLEAEGEGPDDERYATSGGA